MGYAAEEAFNASSGSFITALAVNIPVSIGLVLVFLVIRRWFKAVYEPRTYIPPTKKQAIPFAKGFLDPLYRIISSDPAEILDKNGVDPYVFVRFLRLMVIAIVPIWFLSWATLFPLDYFGPATNKNWLDALTFMNIADAKDKNFKKRFWAHMCMAYVFNIWIMWLISRELKHWLEVRQRHLTSPQHSRLAQANTVLVTNIPDQFMDEVEIANLFSYLPGGIKRVWLNRNLREMPELWEHRLDACNRLETAQVLLIRKATKRYTKIQKKAEALEKKGLPVPEELRMPPLTKGRINKAIIDKVVRKNDRPTMRVAPEWFPSWMKWFRVGRKVDTIDWTRREIAETTARLNQSRKKLAIDISTPGVGKEHYNPRSSAFIHFNQQIAAHMARQCVTYHHPYHMNRRFIEQSPRNVIWSNMSLSDHEVNVRRMISYALTIAIIIGWSVPMIFISGLSTVQGIIRKLPDLEALHWLNGDSLPQRIVAGFITGVVAPGMLSVMNMVLPLVLRVLCLLEGKVSWQETELDLMTRYFSFLVVHNFLIVAFSNGLYKSLTEVSEEPKTILNKLGDNLPAASTFFLTMMLTQLTSTAVQLLQPGPLVQYYLRVIIGGGTPRKSFTARYRMQFVQWGTAFPPYTVFMCIIFSFSVISPMANGVGALFIVLSYWVTKYLYIWVNDQPKQSDSGGLLFPKAMQQLYIGLYIQEAIMCSQFLLRSAHYQAAGIGILGLITVASHYTISQMYSPLHDALPLALAHLSHGTRDIEGGSKLATISEKSETLQFNKFLHRTGSNDSDRTVVASSKEERRKSLRGMIPWDESKGQVATSNRGNRNSWIELPEDRGRKIEAMYDNTAGNRKSQWSASGRLKPIVNQRAVQPDVESQMDNEDPEQQYFAMPGGPGVFRGSDDDANDPDAFFHPASKDAQRIIWLPNDPLGLGAAETLGNLQAGVDSTTRGATLKQARVVVIGPPPDLLM